MGTTRERLCDKGTLWLHMLGEMNACPTLKRFNGTSDVLSCAVSRSLSLSVYCPLSSARSLAYSPESLSCSTYSLIHVSVVSSTLHVWRLHITCICVLLFVLARWRWIICYRRKLDVWWPGPIWSSSYIKAALYKRVVQLSVNIQFSHFE